MLLFSGFLRPQQPSLQGVSFIPQAAGQCVFQESHMAVVSSFMNPWLDMKGPIFLTSKPVSHVTFCVQGYAMEWKLQGWDYWSQCAQLLLRTLPAFLSLAVGVSASIFMFFNFIRSDAACLPRSASLCSVSGFPFSQSSYTVGKHSRA